MPQSEPVSPVETSLTADLLAIIRYLVKTPAAPDYSGAMDAILRVMLHYRVMQLPQYEYVVSKAAKKVMESITRTDQIEVPTDVLEAVDELSVLVVHANSHGVDFLNRNGK